MALEQATGTQRTELVKGNQCLLQVLGQHFLVDVLEVAEETVRISFPGEDYPVTGMQVNLEFHDTEGFNSYSSEVLEGPENKSQSMLLRRPSEARRTHHRRSFRVPTDLTVQIKDQVHVRRYDAALLDLGSGGVLVDTVAPFDFSTTIEVTMSLPGEMTHTVLGKIVHIGESPDNPGSGSKMLGVRFLGATPQVVNSISRYIWKRLRELYPAM